MTAEPLVRVSSLSKSFGGVRAVDHVSFDVAAGEVRGLIGPNGAGKTTLINIASGFLKPDHGSITLGGQDLVRLRPHDVARAGAARTFQGIRLFRSLTALENVLVGAHGVTRGGLPERLFWRGWERAAAAGARDEALYILERVGLLDRRNERPGSLPYGDQRRLELARALASRPRLLLLDEIVAGMTRPERLEIAALVRAIAATQVAMIVVEHDMEFVMALCHRVAVLNFGQLIADGAPESVTNNPAVVAAYLGAPDTADA